MRPPVRTSLGLGRSGIGEGRLTGSPEHARALSSPTLVIPDEFRRFRSLLDTRGAEWNAGAKLARELFQAEADGERVRTLLLSATPYKLYTADAEIEQEEHHQDFLATTRFLLGDDDARVAEIQRQLSGFGAALRRTAGGEPDQTEQGRECEASRRGFVARRDGPHGAGRRQCGPGRHGRPRNRRAISFFGTPSTRCRWRISAHWDILITSASSWLGRRDNRLSPHRSSPADRRFRVLRGPFSVAISTHSEWTTQWDRSHERSDAVQCVCEFLDEGTVLKDTSKLVLSVLICVVFAFSDCPALAQDTRYVPQPSLATLAPICVRFHPDDNDTIMVSNVDGRIDILDVSEWAAPVRILARIMREGGVGGETQGPSVWYKRCATKRLATTEALA